MLLLNFFVLFFVFGQKWVVFLFFVYFSAEKQNSTFGCIIFRPEKKKSFSVDLYSKYFHKHMLTYEDIILTEFNNIIVLQVIISVQFN